MCGLVGFSGPDKFDVDKIKTLLLWNSFERGEDSTGYYSPENGLKKTLMKGSNFIINKNNEYQLIPDNMLIAHVRAATVGSKTDVNNAHPFKRGNYILAHNGTLKNHYTLLNKHQLVYSEYSVDSDIMCGIINKEQNFNVFKEIDGAAAVLITDTNNPELLYVYKNSERPLYKGYIGANMYISSIAEALVFIGCINIKAFKDNCIYTLKNGSIVGNVKKIKNKPYYAVQENYNKRVDDSFKFAKANGGWVRCLVTQSWVSEDGFQFKTTAGKWYLITDVPSKSTVEIHEPITNTNQVLLADHFNEFDIIKFNDKIVAIADVYSKVYNNVPSKKLFSEGDVLEASMVYTDRDISAKSVLSASSITDMFYMKYVRKLTEEELIKYKFDIETLGYISDILEPTLPKQNKPVIVPNNDDNIEVENVEEFENMAEYYDYLVNEKALVDYCLNIDESLESIRNMKTIEEMQEGIKKLIDYNVTTFDLEFAIKTNKNANKSKQHTCSIN